MEALRERFGKYHVLDKIAQGGMAEVYKVKTVGIAGFEKIQALKRILPSSAREDRFIRSFIDEARIAVELTHRNIVQVFDFGKADGELFMAMELIEGKDLRTAMSDAVSKELLPPVPLAAYIVSEVAAGLDYAHRKVDVYGRSLNIVHCDVSPSNVMLSLDGYVKILDFGIARATFASALERRRLRGKPRYMAPEQTLGEPPTAASDVFALGIIAWELFTGRPLFHGPDLRSILEAVRTADPPRVDRLNPQVPPEIGQAVATALRREPAERGAVADLLAACTRTAMAAGARPLSGWLADLDRRPSSAAIGWQPVVTSVSVPGPGATGSGATGSGDEDDEHEPAQAARSMTRSLSDMSPFLPSRPPTEAQGPPPSPAMPTERFSRMETARLPTADRTRTEAVTPVSALPVRRRFAPDGVIPRTDVTAAPEVLARRSSADVTVNLREPALHDPWSTVPYEKAAFDVSELGPSLRPSTIQIPIDDEEPTRHGMPPPPVTAAEPSDEPLDPEPSIDDATDVAAPRPPRFDEPIDDDLGALDARPPAERRRSVVVAGVLAGAPPEVLRPVTRSLGELAYQRGGVVIALDDDALSIAFGLEVAGEDDVAVAMGWAMDAAAMARDAHAAGAAGLALRIGARAGVPAQAGPDAGGLPTLPQEALDEAKALAREASPDRPLFVGDAGRLTSGLYELREVPAPRRITRRSRVIEVVGPRGFDERDRARFERRGSFVGRAAQLAELEGWFRRALSANRRFVVHVAGAAGTGKSRLVAELLARIADTPELIVVSCAGSAASHLTPFATVIDFYQSALRLPPARGRQARAQLVQRLIHLLMKAGVATERAQAITTDLDRALELRDGLGVGARELADLRPRISAGVIKFRSVMIERGQPLVTLIEDVHLADRASVEVLRHTLAIPGRGPELLVITSRPEGGADPLPADAVIQLGDLVGAELRALIADRLGTAATPLNVAAVLARGGGNPLFVEELALAVRDARERGEAVPATAREVVSARVERLSPRARAALRFAAVLGGTVRARLLEELLGDGALEPELDELVGAGFLLRPGAAGSSEGELCFARGLVREVVYESLTADAQRDAHARVGRLLAARCFAGREEPPSTVAEHLERGGELAAAAAFWLRAGRLALTASDADAAAACFSRTLLLERQLGATPPTAPSRARRREALAGREEAHRLTGDLDRDPGDLDALAALCEGEPARLADVALRRALRHLRLGDYPAADAATAEAEGHAIAARDDRLRGEALRVRGEIFERLGQFDEALAVVGAARALFHRRRLPAEEMAAMIGRGRIHLLRADYEAAQAAYRPVLARIERTADPWLERIAANHLAVIDMCLGNFERAMAAAERSLELCRRYGDRAREGDGLSVAGIILLEVGLYDEASATFAEALDVLARAASPWSRADCLIYAGTCELRRGRLAGSAMLDEALAEARRLGARYLEANALVARAGAHLARGALRAAVEDAADGTAVARDATLIGYEIQGLARHAIALVRLGHAPAEAAALVHRALELFERQRYLEGSEEEALLACALVLRAAGAGDRARAVLERARGFAQRKLDALTDPKWRAAFRATPTVRELLAAAGAPG